MIFSSCDKSGLTAFDDETQELPDNKLLERVTELKRVLFAQDIRFRVLKD